ncbi:MAG: hypothetical protein JL50_01080 [Peptococcaceae bacterium BICA1-7]|nr:MAG: hypothetical protein JL50_01080 [Peptococcaceae bacterium BICA1-7]HBV98017.1 pilus assembly protein [Desulfotomaculum sp.]
MSKSIINNRKGSIMLEFVFSVSILMVIFLATVTFSFLFADTYGSQKVAREGAREASMTRDVSWAKVKAEQAAWLWGLDPGRTSIEFYTGGTGVTCTVNYISRPFSKTFPKLLEGSALQDYHINTRATYMWSDTR